MHNNLVLFRSNLERIPHHELLIATHGLAIELMISCALPLDFVGQPFMVKTEEDGKELRIFKGLINIYVIKASPTQTLDEMMIAFETSNKIANAVGLPAFSSTISNFALFEEFESKTRITVQGSMGLTKLQGLLGRFFKKTRPNFHLPFGLDTEIYSRPEKFGFKMAITV